MLRRTLLTLSATLLVAVSLPALAVAQETRTVETPKGQVTIPAVPKRVVATYSTDVDYALVLGLPLVGAGTVRGEAGYDFADHQAGYDLSGAEKIAIFPQTNYEQIAALQPDLIISNYLMEENGYELMSAIAPTLWFDNDIDWQDTLRAYGVAFDKSQVAEDFLAKIETRTAELAAKVPAGTSLALVNNFGDGTFVIMQASDLGTLYEGLGFEPSANVPPLYENRVPYSIERIDLLADADILLLWRNRVPEGGFAPSVYDGMMAIPGWEDLPAVKAGRVYDMPVELFYQSPLTVAGMLDYVEANILQ